MLGSGTGRRSCCKIGLDLVHTVVAFLKGIIADSQRSSVKSGKGSVELGKGSVQ